jgi:hypothetical protein
VHVIGVLIGPLVVVGDQHLRPVPLDQGGDPRRHLLQRDVAERVGPQVVVPFRHAGVPVAEQLQVRDPQDGAGLAQLSQALADYRLFVVPVLARLDATRPVPQLSVGAGHDHGADALGRVGGQDPAGAGRFVVGMRVDRHHRQRFCHASSVPDQAPDRPIGSVTQDTDRRACRYGSVASAAALIASGCIRR